MASISTEIEAFGRKLQERIALARQRAALQLACGIDLDAAIVADREKRRRVTLLVERRLRRERLKGLNRHWSYSLDRHIALKQALETLRAAFARA